MAEPIFRKMLCCLVWLKENSKITDLLQTSSGSCQLFRKENWGLSCKRFVTQEMMTLNDDPLAPFFLQYHIPSQTHIFNLSWSESKFQCYNHIARSLGRILNIQYNQFSCMTSKSGNQVCSYPYSWFLLFSQQYMSKTESSSKNLLYLWF